MNKSIMVKKVLIVVIVSIVIFVAIMAALSYSYRPTIQESVDFDLQREGNFLNLKVDIQQFYTLKKKLPQTLDELDISPYHSRDPETQKMYDYRVDSPEKWSLCTTFSVDSKYIKENDLYPYLSNGTPFPAQVHKKGYDCVQYTIIHDDNSALMPLGIGNSYVQQQISKANNTKRSSDVNAILNAISQYEADKRGNLSAMGIKATPTSIGSGIGRLSGVCALLVPEYIAALPVDPLTNNGTASDCTGSYNTNYTVSKSASGRITVSAPRAELGTRISVTR
jgi:uncharacterized protein YxeA